MEGRPIIREMPPGSMLQRRVPSQAEAMYEIHRLSVARVMEFYGPGKPVPPILLAITHARSDKEVSLLAMAMVQHARVPPNRKGTAEPPSDFIRYIAQILADLGAPM